MADDIKCNLCGGTDFYNEAGHYYCNECQTLTQEIQEHVFATPEEVTTTRRTSSRRVRTEKKPEDSLTSWECYNYIILGLVEELIELGANARLKEVVRILWFKYLSKLEVLQVNASAPPKLPAVNSKVDAAIVYGRIIKKKRPRTPSPTSSSDPSSMDAASLRKEKSKLRRSLVLAEYDEFSNTMQSEDISLHNQSLVSLKSGSDTSRDRDRYLQYNKTAKKELLNIMPKNHLKAHCRDVDSVLNCHKLSYKSVSWKYSHGPDVLSRSRIYAILYLGLLIVKDKIQLGDMLRFIREGCLSFHEIYHFFPEEFSKKNLNIKSWNQRHKLLSHSAMRKAAADMAKFLEVTAYVPKQNLLVLCQRYCAELNLPDEIMGYTLNLMSMAMPKMQLTSDSSSVANYEGRAMSMIIFVLKLMFGMDEVTENKFSAYADNINSISMSPKKMFVWNDWTHFIHYRKLVLTQLHFPTQFLYNNESVHDSSLFVGFMTELNAKHEQDETLTREAEVLKRLLEKLKDRQAPFQNRLTFMPSLTPFKDYLEVVLASNVIHEKNYLIDVLEMNFKDHSLDFLAKPFGYLEKINENKKVGIKHRGANNDIKLIQFNNVKVVREKWRRNAKKLVYVKLCDRLASNRTTINELETSKLEDNVEYLNTKEILKHFRNRHMKTYRKRMKKLLKTHSNSKPESQNFTIQQSESEFQDHQIVHSDDVTMLETTVGETSASQSQSRIDRDTFIHYNPHNRYWLRTFNINHLNQEEFNEFLAKFPDPFKLLLSESARIVEQSTIELFEEFNDVEVYLCYVAKLKFKGEYKEVPSNSNLQRSIKKAMKNW